MKDWEESERERERERERGVFVCVRLYLFLRCFACLFSSCCFVFFLAEGCAPYLPFFYSVIWS